MIPSPARYRRSFSRVRKRIDFAVFSLIAYRAAIDSVFGEGSCYVLNVRNYGALCVTEAL